MDKFYDIKLGKGEVQQYDRSLRWMSSKFHTEQENCGQWGACSGNVGRSGSSNERTSGCSGRWGASNTCSDGPTWKKKGVEEGEEVSSPDKKSLTEQNTVTGTKEAKRMLFEEQKRMEVEVVNTNV